MQCSAPSDFEDQSAIDAANADCRILAPGGSSDAWLTPSQECDWGGVVCNEDRRMDRIIFGTFCSRRTVFPDFQLSQ